MEKGNMHEIGRVVEGGEGGRESFVGYRKMKAQK